MSGKLYRVLLITVVFCRISKGADAAGDAIGAIRAGDLTKARQILQAALQTQKGDPRLWALEGLVEARLKEPQKALDAYKRALAIAPDYLPALEGAAETAYQSSNPQAEQYVRAVLEQRPADETAHGMLAALAYRRGDCAAAVENFAKAQNAIARSTPALRQYGYCLVRLKHADEAVPVFRRVAELAPGDAEAAYRLAIVESLAGEPRAVVETLEPVVARDPNNAPAFALLADAYEALNDTPKAVAALRQAILLRPDATDYYLSFANISMAHDSFQVGVDMLNAGIARSPRSAPLYLARGILYIQQGRYEAAQSDFARAEEMDPQVRFGASAQGLLALQQNNLPAAESTIRARLKAHPNDAYLHYLLAETLVRRGATPGSPSFREALDAVQTAVRLQPVFPLARDLMGRLYLQQGDTKQAIAQSRLAYAEDPNDQMALYHLLIALHKDNQTAEIPTLSKRLAELRAAARAKEASEHRYRLVEDKPGN